MLSLSVEQQQRHSVMDAFKVSSANGFHFDFQLHDFRFGSSGCTKVYILFSLGLQFRFTDLRFKTLGIDLKVCLAVGFRFKTLGLGVRFRFESLFKGWV